MTKEHCVVIGAGLAGLAAAYRLIQNGCTVEVLEADKKRVGGRVFTGRRETRRNPAFIFIARSNEFSNPTAAW